MGQSVTGKIVVNGLRYIIVAFFLISCNPKGERAGRYEADIIIYGGTSADQPEIFTLPD